MTDEEFMKLCEQFTGKAVQYFVGKRGSGKEMYDSLRCPLCSIGRMRKVELKGRDVFRVPNAKCDYCGATTMIHWNSL